MKKINKFLKELIAVIIFSIFFYGCFDEIKSPVMPIWDVEYTIPILSKTEIVKDRIKGSKGIFIDSTSQELLIKLDSTKINSQPLEKFFSDNISFDDDFVIRTNRLDTLAFESYIVDDSVYIERMDLYKGEIEYSIKNHLNKAVDISFKVNNFTKSVAGRIDTLKVDVRINPNSSAIKKIDLAGYKFNKVDTNPITGQPGNGIYVTGIAKIEPNYEGDSVSVNMKLQNLGFNYVKGKFKPYEDVIKTKTNKVDVDNDVKDILPKIYLYGAKLTLSPNINSQNLEIRLKNFQVIGKFNNNPIQQNILKINGRTVLDTIINLSQSVIEINLDDIAINEFMSPTIPDSITYKGDIIFNPNYKSIEAFFPDTIKFTNRLLAYSIFKIDNASRTDTLDISFSDDEKKKLDNLYDGEFNLSYDNYLPLGFRLTGRFLDENNNTLFYFTRERGDGSSSDTVISILGSRINSEGLTSAPSSQAKRIVFTKDEFRRLKNAKKAILNVVFYSSEGKKVKLTANDKIIFRASVKAKTKLEF